MFPHKLLHVFSFSIHPCSWQAGDSYFSVCALHELSVTDVNGLLGYSLSAETLEVFLLSAKLLKAVFSHFHSVLLSAHHIIIWAGRRGNGSADTFIILLLVWSFFLSMREVGQAALICVLQPNHFSGCTSEHYIRRQVKWEKLQPQLCRTREEDRNYSMEGIFNSISGGIFNVNNFFLLWSNVVFLAVCRMLCIKKIIH